MRKAITLCLILLSSGLASAQRSPRTDKILERDLRALLTGFRGNVGVYVRNLRTGQTVAINADTLFPTASTVKIPIQCGLFDKINRGELNYQQELVYKDSLRYDDGIVGQLKDGAKIPLPEVVMLMETTSDNTASLWCQAMAGGGAAINPGWIKTVFPKRG